MVAKRANTSRAVVAWLAVAMVALIVYGSLYPFQVDSIDRDASWWQNLLRAIEQLSWARAGRGDRVANVLLYVPLGFCLALSFDRRLRQVAAVALAMLCGALLSLSIEVLQGFISLRVPSLWDVTLNTGGTLGGALGGVAWRALATRLPASLAAGNARDGAASTVLAAWFAWRLAPFVPDLTLAKLKAALQPLFDPHISAGATAFYMVWWMIVAQAVFVLAGAQRGIEMLLLVIAAVLAGRLFVTSLAFAPSELLALILLLPMLVILHRLWAGTRRLVLLVAFAGVFLIERLVPFSFTASPAHFDLWPFLAWIDAGLPIRWASVFKQIFEYAALAWLLRDAGVAMRRIVWLLPMAVFALELIGLWLPGRDSSPTEPLLALVTTLAVRYIAEAKRDGLTRPRAHSR